MIDFSMKLDGKQVCNACSALGVGYSQRHFKQLKVECSVYGRVTTIHSNTLFDPVRESTRMSAAMQALKYSWTKLVVLNLIGLFAKKVTMK